MNTLYKIALALGIIGCINWGLVGISGLISIGIFTKDLD